MQIMFKKFLIMLVALHNLATDNTAPITAVLPLPVTIRKQKAKHGVARL